ncbi:MULTISPECIES: response regulator [Glaesserella]|uniref:Response regulatory domain-containing protein n=1 Tax=Glaesserella australis TaxID=2094024 RepID=A0A328C0T2_9PAST|nr:MULTISPECIES: response regulator [Glaesserella]AUI66847.1 hypothetical protein CJD39_09780 [Glaesserella sp. 15-184]RAL19899.1 hypothetical protein C5N92_00555 [Glaesserella australis]
MKKILIIDDNYSNQKIVAKLLKDELDKHTIGIETKNTVKSAIDELKLKKYDLVITDLFLPLNLGDEVDNNGAKILMEQIEKNGNVLKPTYIIGITSHKEAYNQYINYFNKKGWRLYINDSSLSECELKENIVNYMLHSPKEDDNVDILIITALQKELDQILNLPFKWENKKSSSHTFYFSDVKNLESKNLRILAVSCLHMGIAASASLTSKLGALFKPKLILMSGIAAGIKGKVNLGDILVAEYCWDWGSGKKTQIDGHSVTKQAPHQMSMPLKYKDGFLQLSKDKKFLNKLFCDYHGNKPPSNLDLHVGPLATGSVVLEDQNIVTSIIDQHRNTLGIEMEAYGVAYASQLLGIDSIIIKSVCDFADTEKNDDYQSYAAYTSAKAIEKFIQEIYDPV